MPTKINMDLDFEKEEFIDFLEKENLTFDGCDEAYVINLLSSQFSLYR